MATKQVTCDCTMQCPRAPKDVSDECMCTNSGYADKRTDFWICPDCSSGKHRWIY